MKGKIPWNKGKSDLHRKSHKDNCICCFCKVKNIRHNNKWNKNIRIKTKEAMKKVEHHIYLKENSDKTIKIIGANHSKLHHRAYDYIYERFGEQGIKKYLKWFEKKYNIKLEIK